MTVDYRPAIKIELYDTADALQYTLTTDVTSAHVHDILTGDIGTFNFTLPVRRGNTHLFTDVALYWKPKIYMGYGTLGASDLLCTGRIEKMQGTVDSSGRYLKTFSGRNLGEILTRRFKTNRRYQELDASTIVSIDVATDLGIYDADKCVADATTETVTIRTESYFDYLRKVSDYWYDAATKVQKDFYVDPEGDLRWIGRPIRTATTTVYGTADAGGDTDSTVDAERTEANDYWNWCTITYLTGDNAGLSRLIHDFVAATDTIEHQAFPNTCDAGDKYVIKGVESLALCKKKDLASIGAEAVGGNVAGYTVTRDLLSVKNSITVYGAAKAPYPLDRDDWTDALDYDGDAADEWSSAANAGVLSVNPGAPVKAGTNWIKSTSDAGTKNATFGVEIPKVYTRDISSLRFWNRITISNADTALVRLYAPDSSNYFELHSNLDLAAGIYWNSLALGEDAEYDADENPTGIWDVGAGSPNWWNIQEIWFHYHDSGAGMVVEVDKMFFYPDRFYDTASDAASIAAYGQRDAEYTDENLQSTTECQKRAETLLMQLKDPVTRVDMAMVRGNSNIKIGDRISVTIPAENISAASYDIMSVDYDWAGQTFGTSFSSVNSSSTRTLPPLNYREAMINQLRNMREVTSERFSRIVK